MQEKRKEWDNKFSIAKVKHITQKKNMHDLFLPK